MARPPGKLKRAGRELRGACPIHKGKNPRQFVIDPAKGVWRCFGDCGRGGGTLEFVAALEGVSIKEAAARIAAWFAIVSQPLERSEPMSEKQQPSHKVFVVEDREKDDAFWTRIGTAWPHKDSDGFNVVLSALPINGRLVLRAIKDEEPDEEPKKNDRSKRR